MLFPWGDQFFSGLLFIAQGEGQGQEATTSH